MKFSTLVLLPCLAAIGCGAHSGSTETVCTSHLGRSCTHDEVRESAEGQFFRESQDRFNQERAARDGTAFFPTHAPGESSFHYLERVQSANGASKGKSGSSSGPCCGGSAVGSPSFGGSSSGSSFGGSSSGSGSSFGGSHR